MSIHRQLLFGLLLGLVLLFALAGTAFYFSVRAILNHQFDAALAAKANTLCSLLARKPSGQVELELPQTPSLPLGIAARAEYFEIWREDGTLLFRSSALGRSDLPRCALGSAPQCTETQLPDGHPGKAMLLHFVPPVDEDETDGKQSPGQAVAAPSAVARSVIVAVAQDRFELDQMLQLLLSALLLMAAFVGAGTTVIVRVVVRQGLKPLGRVAQEAARIDEQSLHLRFRLDDLPGELKPICQRLNDSLSRLQQAFQRERRFTADVAHELRTPIAELRTLADVALTGDGDSQTSLDYFKDAQEIARQMERLVTALLALARCQAGTTTVERHPVDLAEAVRDAWLACQTRAAERSLEVVFDLPAGLSVEADRTILPAILGNLLSNAVEYTTGGTIACRADRNDSRVTLRVVNAADTLVSDDLPHLFEPFWRKDAARSDGFHCGLGLALASAYAELLGGKTKASLTDKDTLCVALELPAATTVPKKPTKPKPQ